MGAEPGGRRTSKKIYVSQAMRGLSGGCGLLKKRAGLSKKKEKKKEVG